MRILPLLICTLVSLAVFGTPTLAIDKSDVISQYRTEKPTAPAPKEKFSMNDSLLDLPEWLPMDPYSSLYTAWRFHGGLSYFYELCPDCGEPIHFILPDGTVI